MFGFLTPLALAGLGLLAIPILLHIFKPRKVRQTPFSSLRWLRASQHRLSRRIRWHQVLLLLLRALFVALLVLALAKPILSLNSNALRRDRFIILDTSRSMAVHPEHEPVPFTLAKDVAAALIGDVLAGDRTSILLAGTRARMLCPMMADASSLLPQLRALEPEEGGSDLDGALRLARSAVTVPRPDASLEITVITDNNAQNWSQRAVTRTLDSITSPVSVRVIDVGPAAFQNAWITEARYLESSTGTRGIRVQLAAQGSAPAQRLLRLTSLEGFRDQVREVEIRPGTPLNVFFDLPPDDDFAGKVAQLRLDPPDRQEADDRYWLNLDSTVATRVLIVEPESTHVEELQPGFHIRKALEALAAASRDRLDTRVRRPSDPLAGDIDWADLIIMVDVPNLLAADVDALHAAVWNGTGLAVFLGPSIDRTFYNTSMFNPLSPATSLLPCEVGPLSGSNNPPTARPRLSEVEWTHPLFARLFDPLYGDLPQARFSSYHELKPGANTEKLDVLASIGGRAPFLVEKRLGAGTVLLFNTTANDAWSDLPRRKSFVPLIDRLVEMLGGGARQGAFVVGEPVALTLPLSSREVTVSVEAPSGDRLTPLVTFMGNRPLVQIDAVREPGVYRVIATGEEERYEFPIVVQPPLTESAYLRMDEAVLRSWWAPATFEVDRLTGTDDIPDHDRSRMSLDPWVLLLAALILMAEMYFVHQLCPRVNPGVTSHSVVASTGFFRDGTEGGLPEGESDVKEGSA